MIGPRKTKPRGGNREALENTTSWASDSGAEHTADTAEALIRLGAMLAMQGCEALYLLIDEPEPSMVDAADCISAAGQYLALSAEFRQPLKGATRPTDGR